MQLTDLSHLLIAELLITQGFTVLLVLERILISLDMAMKQKAFRYLRVVAAQHEGDDRQFVKRPPPRLGTGGVAGPEQALYLGRHEAGTSVKQGERRALDIVAIRLPAMACMEILTRLQAADANTLIKIQSWTPPQLQALLEVMPNVPLLPKHARSTCLQTLGKDVGRGVRGCAKCFSDPILIGSAAGRLSSQLIKQFCEGLSRAGITPLPGRIARAAQDTAETLGRTQKCRPNIHQDHAPTPAC